MIISAPILSSPEGSFFYPPIIADPNPAAAGSIFQGSFSVWRTQDWGGDQAYLEANCPEFTTSAAQPGCGNFVPIGTASHRRNSPTRRGEAGPAARSPGSQRASQNTGIDVGGDEHGPRVHHRKRERSRRRPSSGTGSTRGLDRSQPSRHRDLCRSDESAIMRGSRTAATTSNTPAQPGHVFEVTWSGAGAATLVDRQLQPARLPDNSRCARRRDG